MPSRLSVLVLVFAVSSCVGPLSEDFESHYQGVAAARADGAFTRGWLPAIVPPDATEISEFHNIDTNRTWACFSTRDVPAVRTLLAKRGAQRVNGPVHTGPSRFLRVRPWWPSSMTSPSVEAFSFNEDTDSRVLVGIDTQAARVCFHRS
jgi:hypothetical protein